MSMPEQLVVVRHALSEENLEQQKEPVTYIDIASLPEDTNVSFTDKDSRLAHEGIEQAVKTGKWIVENITGTFDRSISSPSTRTLETAQLLDVSDSWSTDRRIRERSPGIRYVDLQKLARTEPASAAAQKIIYQSFPGGESFVNLEERIRSLLHDLEDFPDTGSSVLLVSHGGAMHGLRSVIENFSDEKIVAMFGKESDEDHIDNCEVFQYSRKEPETGEIVANYRWCRRVKPWDSKHSLIPASWTEMAPATLDSEKLKKLIEKKQIGTQARESTDGGQRS